MSIECINDQLGHLHAIAKISTCKETVELTKGRAISLKLNLTGTHHKQWLDSILAECEARAHILDSKQKRLDAQYLDIAKSCTTDKFTLNELTDPTRQAH